jgi:hypothetical protein
VFCGDMSWIGLSVDADYEVLLSCSTVTGGCFAVNEDIAAVLACDENDTRNTGMS